MKIIIIFIIILTCTCNSTQAQVNFVLNPSLEQYSQCPTFFDQIKYAKHWSSIDSIDIDPLCSPDYCNACDSLNGYVSAPTGAFYHHYAHSGYGMAEVQMFFDESFSNAYKRDYLQGRLYSSLIAGTSYCVTFYVNLEDGSRYAVDNIGAYIDNGSIDEAQDSAGCASPQTTHTPQVLETSIIDDTLDWVQVQGSFVANGTEKFITIGNFYDKAHTDYTILNSSMGVGSVCSWYLVDDVSIIESNSIADAGADAIITQGDSVHIGTNEEGMPNTWYVLDSTTPIGYSGGIWVRPDSTTSYVVEMDLCGHVTYDTVKVTVWPLGIGNINKYANVEVYPNPTTGSFTIEHASGAHLIVCDVVGKEVYDEFISSDREKIAIEDLPHGVYMVQVIAPSTGKRIVKKIVKE